MHRWKGAVDLLFDAVAATTDLVERTQASVANKAIRPFTFVEPLSTVATAVRASHDTAASFVYTTIRGVTRGVEKLFQLALTPGRTEVYSQADHAAPHFSTPLRSTATNRLSWWMDHTESTVNGLCGDHLYGRNNGLDLGMSLRHHGRRVPLERTVLQQTFPGATGKLCVFVHGLKCTEWVWRTSAARLHGDPTVTFGSLLQHDLDFTPLFVRYNTGLCISENGGHLSALLRRLVAAYPRAVNHIVLVGHSMGGLVVESAVQGRQAGDDSWIRPLRHVFCLGAPHLGAPLPKATAHLSRLLGRFDTAGTQVISQILDARSAGMKSLRFGRPMHQEGGWNEPTDQEQRYGSSPPAEYVDTYHLAATITHDPRHPMGQLLGDLLVRPRSAAGSTGKPTGRNPHHSSHLFGGMHHFDLVNHPDVYAFIRQRIASTNVPSAQLPEAEQPGCD